jgi:hypothetical protein
MNTVQNLIAEKKVNWVRYLVLTAALAGLAALAPVVWMAVTGGAGLFVLAGLLAAAFSAVQAIPLLGQKLENALLKARKAEARRNPIEQLQVEVLRRAERLKSFRRALISVASQIESISQMMAERRHRDPTHELDRQQNALNRLQQFHRVNLGKLSQAQAALEEFKSTVERKESEWRIALAIGDASDMLDPNATDNLMHHLLTDAALRSVQERFNSVFAELDVQMSSIDGPTRLLLDQSNLDRMGALQLPEQISWRVSK